MDLRQLIQLKRKSLSNRKVAEALGVSRNTVNTYVHAFTDHELSYEQLEGLSDGKLAGLFSQADAKDAQRYEQLAGYFPTFGAELRKTGCTLQTLWRGYLEDHPNGYRYTQFVHYYNLWADKKTKAIVGVGDNMKAVVAKGHKYAPLINKTLKDLALHYGSVIDPTRPYHPKDKDVGRRSRSAGVTADLYPPLISKYDYPEVGYKQA